MFSLSTSESDSLPTLESREFVPSSPLDVLCAELL